MLDNSVSDKHKPVLSVKIDLRQGIFRFHTMVKPSGAQCNLNCSYCFYLHKEQLLAQPKQPRMSDEILEEHIRQYIEAQTGDEVIFSWQGGEPTLMGLAFFEKVVFFQKKYKKKYQNIENDLQTNGLLLTRNWCQFIKDNNFLVGLSIDGPQHLHDKHRVSHSGKPTHYKVMETVELLHEYNVPFAALCVVNRDNAKYPLDVYRFLRDDVNPIQIQFIPGIEKKEFYSTAPSFWENEQRPILFSSETKPGVNNSVVTDWSIESEDWGYFLNTIWDEWFEKDFGNVFIDQFENVVSMLLGNGSQKCVTSQICGKALAIEHNGDVFSCDHFVYPEYKLGNIQSSHEGDLAYSVSQQKFAFDKFKMLPDYCNKCTHLNLCWGHCPKDRFLKTPDGDEGLQYLCTGLKVFYDKVVKEKERLILRLS